MALPQAPLNNWDALICTSELHSALEVIWNYIEDLWQIAAVDRPKTQLPVIPLSINTDIFRTSISRQDARRPSAAF